MTENAVMTIRDLASQQGAPQTGGVRITADPMGRELTIEPAVQPDQGDQVVEDLGARIFLDAGAASMLDDKSLDAGVDEQGEIEFAILNRPQ